MTVPAVALSAHENESLNNESLFSQFALELVEIADTAAAAGWIPVRIIRETRNDARMTVATRVPVI